MCATLARSGAEPYRNSGTYPLQVFGRDRQRRPGETSEVRADRMGGGKGCGRDRLILLESVGSHRKGKDSIEYHSPAPHQPLIRGDSPRIGGVSIVPVPQETPNCFRSTTFTSLMASPQSSTASASSSTT